MLSQDQLYDAVAGPENIAAIDRTQSLLQTRTSVLFAGAGVSKRAGLPLWEELLDQFCDILEQSHQVYNRETRETSDLLKRAQCIKEEFIKLNRLAEFNIYLKKSCEIAPSGSLDLHSTLLTLPIRGVVTTNFDSCFEKALYKTNKMISERSSLKIGAKYGYNVRTFFDVLRDPTQGLSVLHLHGHHDEPDACILTESDFIDAYGEQAEKITSPNYHNAPTRWPLLKKTLWALLATQRIIFVGFGMTDPFIRAMMQYVGRDVWDQFGQVHSMITSVSLTSSDPAMFRKKMCHDMGIDVVFYEAYEKDHSRLDVLLSKLGAIPPTPTSNALQLDEWQNKFDHPSK